MDKLAKASNTIEIIKKYDFVFQKRYGQNFLTDTHVIDKIMDAAGLTKEDYVIEIGRQGDSCRDRQGAYPHPQ